MNYFGDPAAPHKPAVRGCKLAGIFRGDGGGGFLVGSAAEGSFTGKQARCRVERRRCP